MTSKGPIEVSPVMIREELLRSESSAGERDDVVTDSNPGRPDSSWSAILNGNHNIHISTRSSISTIGTGKSSTVARRQIGQLSPVIEESKTVRNASVMPQLTSVTDFASMTTRREYISDVISLAETGRFTKWTRDRWPHPPRPDFVPPLSFNQQPWIGFEGLRIRKNNFRSSSASSGSSPLPIEVASDGRKYRSRKYSTHHLLDNADRLHMANNLLAKSDASEECSDISKEGAVSPGNNDEKQSGDAEFLDEVIMKPPVRLRRHSEGALSLPSDETQGTGFKGQINITEPFPQSILDILERLKTERDREEPADELLNEQKGDVIPGDVDENIKGQQDARAYENSKRPLLTRPRPRIGVDALFASKGKSIVNEVENETGSRLEPSTPVAPSVSRDHNLLSVDRNILRGDSRNSRRTSNLSSIRREQRPLGTISETGDYDVLFQRKGYESPPIPHVYHAPEYDINLQRTATTERRHDHPAADDDLDNGKNGADDSGTMVLEAAVWEYKTDPVKISVRKDDVDRTSFETMLSDPNCNLIGPFRRPNLHFDGPFRLIKPVDLPSGERIYVLDKSQPLYPAQNSWSSDPGTERYRARTPSLAPDDWSRMIEPNEAMDGRINSTIGLRDVYRCEEDDPENGGGVLVDRIFEIGAPVRRRVFRETVQPYLTDVDGRVSDRPWFEEGKILPAPERNQPVGRTSDLNDKKNAKRRASRLINEAPPSEQNEQEAGDEKSSVKAGSSTKLKKPGFTTDMLIAKRQSLGSVASFYEINDRHSLHHVPREYGLIDNNDSRETIDPQRDIFVPRDPGELGLPAGYGDLVPRKLSAEEIAAKRRLTETKDVDEKPRVKPNDRRVVSEFRDAADLNQQLRNGSLPQIGSDNLGHYSGNDDARRPESNVSWQSREPSIVAMAEDRQKLRIYSRRYVITNSNFHWNGYRVKSKNNRLIEKC